MVYFLMTWVYNKFIGGKYAGALNNVSEISLDFSFFIKISEYAIINLMKFSIFIGHDATGILFNFGFGCDYFNCTGPRMAFLFC